LQVAGCGTRFVQEWQANHVQFPRGIDIVFASGNRLCGLPRTTWISG
jgi:alpha-D-ribose 1-methylphosphonate 5-triphosphate synthase subunit PhnH